ncbi:haloalkane dehalogenase [Temperatibacter marinus]|uniref:Haloalkane dehalogenase n=1 Tax=Temperatibacter marinus TaxID=1456591 RepID=A0AA52EBG7_9PROT|nr:haloalkane dehalogenase [Temperatibacter marinus]WND01756.1 haloalkane dehalogenase [Temperatibacter marinus]
MELIQSSEEQFTTIPDYPFSPNFVAIKDRDSGSDMRMHYVDEGRADHPLVLLLHGEPSWSFLYRKMIPLLVQAGYRVIAPDLIGFGKSDKILERDYYTYARHIEWMTDFVDRLGLTSINLFCQDWGGLIGLRLVAATPHLFASVVTSNTFLPTGADEPSEAFLKWQSFSQSVPEFPTGKIIQGATVSTLTEAEVYAYDAPYAEEAHKAGARQFPTLVPTSLDNPESENNQKAWEVLQTFTNPWLCLFGDSDPVTKGADQFIMKMVPGCQGQPHKIMEKGGHFIQEDCGPALVEMMVSWYRCF